MQSTDAEMQAVRADNRRKQVRNMRRSDREISDMEEIIRIMEKCDVCRLALLDETYPYILPLNFGFQRADNRVTLYFHGADQGKKYELIRKNSHAGFEMDCAHKLVTGEEACSYSMEYESVIGRGRLEFVPEEEKQEALRILMKHYSQKELPFRPSVIAKTTVMKLVAEEVTGKAHRR